MSARFLLDTNVVCEMTKPSPSPAVKAWMDRLDVTRFFISELTVGELHKGIAHLPPCKRRTDLEIWLDRSLLPMFDGRILAVDLRVWVAWGRLCGEGLRRGRPLPIVDSLLAAMAMEHNLTLATRDRGLRSTGVKLVDPWRG